MVREKFCLTSGIWRGRIKMSKVRLRKTMFLCSALALVLVFFAGLAKADSVVSTRRLSVNEMHGFIGGEECPIKCKTAVPCVAVDLECEKPVGSICISVTTIPAIGGSPGYYSTDGSTGCGSKFVGILGYCIIPAGSCGPDAAWPDNDC